MVSLKASSRRKANRVRGLQDGAGNWIEEDEGMENITNQYFLTLFHSSNPDTNSIETILDSIPRRVTKDQNSLLLQEFTREEVYMVIKGMHPSKAPGPDGIQAMFYQKYWDIVGEEVTDFCLDVLNGEGSLS